MATYIPDIHKTQKKKANNNIGPSKRNLFMILVITNNLLLARANSRAKFRISPLFFHQN